MKKFNEGKLYGGIALIVVGVIILIENIESLPFAICLFIGGGALIFFSIERIPSTSVLFLCKCESVIDEYESPIDIGNQSCKSKVIGLIEEDFGSHTPNIDNIEKQSRTLLLNKCYSLLSSGEFHIHFGTLNPYGIAPSLRKVYEGCAKWLLDNNYLTKEQYDENHRCLQENIDMVG